MHINIHTNTHISIQHDYILFCCGSGLNIIMSTNELNLKAVRLENF